MLNVEPLVCWHITPSELHALTVALADAEEAAQAHVESSSGAALEYSDWHAWHDEHEPWSATVAHLRAIAGSRWRTYARTGE